MPRASARNVASCCLEVQAIIGQMVVIVGTEQPPKAKKFKLAWSNLFCGIPGSEFLLKYRLAN